MHRATAFLVVCLILSCCSWAQANIGVALDPNYPYTRDAMTTQNALGKMVSVIALGYYEPTSTLYGVQYNGQDGNFVTSTDYGFNWQDTGSSPWSVDSFKGNIQGLVFAGNYVFSYTDAGGIFRADFTSQQINKQTHWTDVSVPFKQRPPSAQPGAPVPFLGRPDSLVAHGNYLFYGNYNLDPNVPPQSPLPANNQGAHLYRSPDFGATWVEVLTLPYARHVHTIGSDPNPNHLQNVYVSIGDGGYGQTGLYLSTSNGDLGTFNQISANRYGIDFAFPDPYPVTWTTGITPLTANLSRVLLEGDRPPSMIESFDESQLNSGCAPFCVTDSLVTADDNPPDGVSWRGSAGGIKYTQEGNLFWVASGEGGNIGLRSGVWMARGPAYTNWVLVEDTAPPIATATVSSNCVVTVTTKSPLRTDPASGNTYVQIGTYVVVDGTSSSGLNGTSGPITSIDTSSKVFTYTATPCPGAGSNMTGGVAAIVTGWEFYKTFDAGDYLFNFYFRIKRPQFTGQTRGQRSW
jgi:hypothetical protein